MSPSAASERPPQGSEEPPGARGAPRVSNANRVIVGFPFSTIRIHDGGETAQVAELVARLCRAVSDGASEDLDEIGHDADELARRLRHRT